MNHRNLLTLATTPVVFDTFSIEGEKLTRVEFAYRIGTWRAAIQVQREYYRAYNKELADHIALAMVEGLAQQYKWN